MWLKQLVSGFDIMQCLILKLAIIFEYFLQKGPAIAQGLAEIIQRKPADPVEYLANFLHKFVENTNQQARVNMFSILKYFFIKLFILY